MDTIVLNSLSTLCVVCALPYSTDSSNYSDYHPNDYEKLRFQTLNASDVVGAEGIDRTNIDFDRDLNVTCDKLRVLDLMLTNMSETLPVKSGERMMKALKAYNQACLDLLFLCNIDKLKALLTAEDILTPGGPNFLDIKINEKKAEERFEWDEDKVDELNAVIKKSYEHWNDLWFIFNNYPDNMFRQ